LKIIAMWATKGSLRWFTRRLWRRALPSAILNREAKTITMLFTPVVPPACLKVCCGHIATRYSPLVVVPICLPVRNITCPDKLSSQACKCQGCALFPCLHWCMLRVSYYWLLALCMDEKVCCVKSSKRKRYWALSSKSRSILCLLPVMLWLFPCQRS